MMLVLWGVCLAVLAVRGPSIAFVACVLFATVCTSVQILSRRKISQRRATNESELILRRTFGRFTPLAMYGSIAVLAILGIASRLSQNRILVRIFLLYLVFFLIFGLYLCYLVSVGKNEEQHNRENKGGDP